MMWACTKFVPVQQVICSASSYLVYCDDIVSHILISSFSLLSLIPCTASDTHPLYHALHRFDVLHKDHLSHRSITKAFRELHFTTLDRYMCVCMSVCVHCTMASCSYLLTDSPPPPPPSLYAKEMKGKGWPKGTGAVCIIGQRWGESCDSSSSADFLYHCTYTGISDYT